jgi:hypothetical protein
LRKGAGAMQCDAGGAGRKKRSGLHQADGDFEHVVLEGEGGEAGPCGFGVLGDVVARAEQGFAAFFEGVGHGLRLSLLVGVGELWSGIVGRFNGWVVLEEPIEWGSHE